MEATREHRQKWQNGPSLRDYRSTVAGKNYQRLMIFEMRLLEILVKGLSYSYFNVFGISILFYMFFLYTHTFQKSKIQMGEAPLFLIY